MHIYFQPILVSKVIFKLLIFYGKTYAKFDPIRKRLFTTISLQENNKFAIIIISFFTSTNHNHISFCRIAVHHFTCFNSNFLDETSGFQHHSMKIQSSRCVKRSLERDFVVHHSGCDAKFTKWIALLVEADSAKLSR